MRYHRSPVPGKLSVVPTKPLSSSEELSLAYSPGVAHACTAIAQDPSAARTLTGKSNLVAVISDGTAVLGLGNIGPLASKPVMEGKAALFKKLANIDAFDLEITPGSVQETIQLVRRLAPTFGGINLEDIKAPDCFLIEEALQDLGIPVFHDDQHGTAIVVAAAALNGLQHARKNLSDVKMVVSGAGAGALACLKLLETYGLKKSNVWVFDSKGLIHNERTDLSVYKQPYAATGPAVSLKESLAGADFFLGLSQGGLLQPHMLEKMAHTPLVFALANPHPEILPEDALKARPDALMATGRSDYPNQVNNVLCFPYLFRGALDAGAKQITLPMKQACVDALRTLAPQKNCDGSPGLLPQPLDQRLLHTIPPAVIQIAQTL